MAVGINYKGDKRMEELKQKLIDLCNNSGLSLEAILFVTRDLMRDVEAALRRYEQQEKQQMEQAAAEAEQKESEENKE